MSIDVEGPEAAAWSANLKEWQDALDAKDAEIARLRKALEWYAGDGSTYDGIDVGLRAREALAINSQTEGK